MGAGPRTQVLPIEEETTLDEGYVRQASLHLEPKILRRTVWMLLAGNHRDEAAIFLAIGEKAQTNIRV
jgi:hypothetical protein